VRAPVGQRSTASAISWAVAPSIVIQGRACTSKTLGSVFRQIAVWIHSCEFHFTVIASVWYERFTMGADHSHA
jgi:hypothetical protein